MSEPEEQVQEGTKYMVCVVVCVEKKPRKYANYYLCVNGDKVAAKVMRDQIAKGGFRADGRRFFSDEIESLNIKQVEETTNEQ
jgi:hypothetical protein